MSDRQSGRNVFCIMFGLVFVMMCLPGFAGTTLFHDDFQDGNANGWSLASGWSVVNNSGNFVLSGTTASTVGCGSHFWQDYRFKADVRFRDTASGIKLVFRKKGYVSYLIGFDGASVTLSKSNSFSETVLQSVSEVHTLDQWYAIAIVGNQANLQIYLNNVLKINYTDNSNPLLMGAIGFKTVGEANVQADNVVVTTDDALAWTDVYGPAGTVQTLAISSGVPPTLYAGTLGNGGGRNEVWGSTTTVGGQWWTIVTTGVTSSNMSSFAIDPVTPANVYMATENSGILKSTDGRGEFWTVMNTGLGNTNVHAVAVAPSLPTTVYAGTWGNGVYRSANSGWSWMAQTTGPAYIQTLAVHPTTPSTLYAGTNGAGIYKSTNSGSTWSGLNSAVMCTDVRDLKIDPSAPTTLYAATNGQGVCKSTNSGGVWSLVNTGLPNLIVHAIELDPNSPTILYAAPNNAGVYMSKNGGISWSPAGLTGVDVRSLEFVPATPNALGALYAGTNGDNVFMTFIAPLNSYLLWTK